MTQNDIIPLSICKHLIIYNLIAIKNDYIWTLISGILVYSKLNYLEVNNHQKHRSSNFKLLIFCNEYQLI